MSLSTAIAVENQSVDLTATLSKHDVEFGLLPPSPDQVVDSNVSGATPAPMAPASSSTRSAASRAVTVVGPQTRAAVHVPCGTATGRC